MRRQILGAALICSLFAQPAVAATEIQNAIELARTGKTKEAQGIVTKVLKAEPKNVQAIMLQGAIYSGQNLHDKAIEYYTKAINLEPKNTTAFILRSQSYGKKGMQTESQADMQRAIKSNPQLEAQVNAQMSKAMAAANAALQKGLVDLYVGGEKDMKSNALDAGHLKGKTLLQEKKFDEAIGVLTQAIDSYPTSKKVFKSEEMAKFRLSETYQNRAFAHLLKKEFQKGVDDLNKAIELTPKHKESYLNRSKAYELLGDKAKAEADKKTANALAPNWRPAVFQAALDKSAQAAKDYAKQLKAESVAKAKANSKPEPASAPAAKPNSKPQSATAPATKPANKTN